MSAVAPATASSPAFCRARALSVPLDTRRLRGQQNDSARGSCSSSVLISQKPANACANSTVGSHSQVMLVSAIAGYCGGVRHGRAPAVPGPGAAPAGALRSETSSGTDRGRGAQRRAGWLLWPRGPTLLASHQRGSGAVLEPSGEI
jgi:hypothetical protein